MQRPNPHSFPPDHPSHQPVSKHDIFQNPFSKVAASSSIAGIFGYLWSFSQKNKPKTSMLTSGIHFRVQNAFHWAILGALVQLVRIPLSLVSGKILKSRKQSESETINKSLSKSILYEPYWTTFCAGAFVGSASGLMLYKQPIKIIAQASIIGSSSLFIHWGVDSLLYNSSHKLDTNPKGFVVPDPGKRFAEWFSSKLAPVSSLSDEEREQLLVETIIEIEDQIQKCKTLGGCSPVAVKSLEQKLTHLEKLYSKHHL